MDNLPSSEISYAPSTPDKDDGQEHTSPEANNPDIVDSRAREIEAAFAKDPKAESEPSIQETQKPEAEGGLEGTSVAATETQIPTKREELKQEAKDEGQRAAENLDRDLEPKNKDQELGNQVKAPETGQVSEAAVSSVPVQPQVVNSGLGNQALILTKQRQLEKSREIEKLKARTRP